MTNEKPPTKGALHKAKPPPKSAAKSASKTPASGPKHSAKKAPRTPRVRVQRPPVEPRIKERKIKVAREAGQKRLRIVVAMIAVIAVVVGLFSLLHSSLFSAKNFVVTGLKHTTETQVLQAAGLSNHPALINVSASADATAIEKLPWIKSAVVKRSWPSTVHVTVTERAPIGQAAISHGYAIIDASGRVLADLTTPTPHLVSITDLSSLPAPGSTLTTKDQTLVATAAATPVSLVNEISYVGTTKKDGIVLGLKQGPVVVFSTDTDLRQKMVSLATLLAPRSKVALTGIVTIDLRVPSSPVLTK